MEISFFTTEPFTVEVDGTSHSLTQCEKILIVIAGVAGLALFLVGSIFTFYGTSYLLRKQKVESLKQIQPIQPSEILNQFKKIILDTIEELHPIDDLQFIECLSISPVEPTSTPLHYKNMNALTHQTLKEVLSSKIETSLENRQLEDQTKSVKWRIIARDSKGIFHAAISTTNLSLAKHDIAFYRNINPSNKEKIIAMINEKWEKRIDPF